MPFDPTLATALKITATGSDLHLTWNSSALSGLGFQVYADRRLAWSGIATSCDIPAGAAWIDVGAVPTAELETDYSATLAPVPQDRASLSWSGGTYLDPGITAFLIFGSSAPGGPVSYAAPLARVAAYDRGLITDGFGSGGFGSGGFGQAGSVYQWTSGVLAPGAWQFAVETLDASGATSPAASASVTIVGPPAPPALNADGDRLTYAYDRTTRVATLNWLPSPQ